MSEYATQPTQFRDGNILLETLQEMGFNPTNAIGNPQPLYGYQGDFRTLDGVGHTKDANKAMKADIIIPRSQVGDSSNDIGFVKSSTGTYSAVISAYDSHKYGKKWNDQLWENYSIKLYKKEAKRQGLRFLGVKTLANGKKQARFAKN